MEPDPIFYKTIGTIGKTSDGTPGGNPWWSSWRNPKLNSGGLKSRVTGKILDGKPGKNQMELPEKYQVKLSEKSKVELLKKPQVELPRKLKVELRWIYWNDSRWNP